MQRKSTISRAATGVFFFTVLSVYSGQSRAEPGADLSVPVGSPTTQPTNLMDPFASEPMRPTQDVKASDVNFDAKFGTVEMHVSDASLVDVLRMLSLQSQKNIVASNKVSGVITANLYGVTVREALDAILRSNGYVWKEEGNFIYVFTQAEVNAQQKANRVARTEIFRLSYAPVDQVANMIKPALSTEAQVAMTTPAKAGLASGTGDTGGNTNALTDTIVVTDYDENLEMVRRIIKEVDRRPQQILVEATILTARLTENNKLGIDFTVLGGVDFNGINAGSSLSSNGLTGAISGQSNGLSPQSIVAGNTGQLNDRGYVAGSFGGSGMKLGIVKNNIAMFLEALETTADTVLLANPKVLVLNKQKGEVRVGSELGYRSQTLTADSTTAGSVEFLETGTSLIFRPFIAEDGYIRMEVLPEESTGTLVDDAGGKLPQKQTSKVVTNILVKDGKTIVIGGLFRETNSTSRGQVPGLGNAPIIGPLFRKQSDDTVREELIILLTPHIVKDHDTYSELSERDLARFKQIRSGVRRGMMFFGRERLAESSYDAAVTEMSKPNPNRARAIWFLNQATNLNPRFIEAVEMKQELTGIELRSVDNGIAKDFIRDLIKMDVEAKESAFTFEGKSLLDGSTAKVAIDGLPAQPKQPAPAPREPEIAALAPPTIRRLMVNPLAALDLDWARNPEFEAPNPSETIVKLPND